MQHSPVRYRDEWLDLSFVIDWVGRSLPVLGVGIVAGQESESTHANFSILDFVPNGAFSSING